MPASPPETDSRFLVVDGLLSVSVAHGLARITLAQAGPDGNPVPAGQIAVPLARLPAVAGGFLSLLRRLEESAREGARKPAPAEVEPGDHRSGKAAAEPAPA